MKTRLLFLLFGLLSISLVPATINAQSDVQKFELGGQFSLLNFDSGSNLEGRHNELGGGGRFTYNFNKHIAAEGQVDFFPTEDKFRTGPPLNISLTTFGRKTLGVAGVKAGTRTDHFGIFAKARPGFVYFSDTPSFVCIASPCPQPAKTNFAFDVGGVFEYYPSPRTIIRFDAGDTIIHHQRYFGTTHQFQTSAGIGFRF